MAIELIDSHIHLDAKEFESDRLEVIQRAQDSGVTTLVSIGAGYGAESAARAVQLSKDHECVYATVGIHPHDAATPLDATFLEILLKEPKVVAIGETGLDFYRDWCPHQAQEAWFRLQVELAIKFNKPLIIHSRDAAEKCLSILEALQASQVGGVFHCYSEDAHFADRLREINFLVSIPGSVTFKKAEKLHAAVKQIPLEQIMLETDAPFLAPEPFRGKRCESSYMIKTAEKIAELKSISIEEVARVTTQTARKFFKLESR